MKKTPFLEQIRLHELINYGLIEIEKLSLHSSNKTILEIGAGTGQQAKLISSKGYYVIALDMNSSSYRKSRVYPIVEYDGINLPIKEKSISIIFSSNVLEHIREIDNFFLELNKTLDEDGYAIHILPTSAWRIWSNISHYAWILKKIFHIFIFRDKPIKNEYVQSSLMGNGIRHLMPIRHGERGNFITEIYYFSKYYWQKTFKENGYTLVYMKNCNLFYTNSNIFGEMLPIRFRILLSRLLGSACKIYVLKKADKT
jgi:SAM-dependent methyltransferase